MKFLSNADLIWQWGIFTREVVIGIWIACGVAIVVYIFDVVSFFYQGPRSYRLNMVQLVVGLAFGVATLALVPGLRGKPLGELESFLPPLRAELGTKLRTPTSEPLEWITNDYGAALLAAKQQGKSVFIDFTGYTCTNCRWMEANMFTRLEVSSQLARFVLVRLYTDGDGKLYEEQQNMEQKEYGTIALPLYAIVRSNGQPIANFPGLTRSSAEFVSFLQKAEASAVSSATLSGH